MEKFEPIKKTVQKKYKEGTMEDSEMSEGGRNLNDYERELLFDRNDLKGKSVLDLGAGPEIKLARQLKDENITSDVISLSPDFSDEKFIRKAKMIMPDAKLVPGIGQELPFKNDSFDIIFALDVDEHLSKEQFFEVISEMARTLKVGGKATIGPTHNKTWVWDKKDWKPYEAILENKELKEKLDKFGIEVEKVMIPKETMTLPHYEPAFDIVLKKYF